MTPQSGPSGHANLLLVLYFIALLVVSVFICGAGEGMILGSLIFAAWAYILSGRLRSTRLVRLCIVFVIPILLFMLFPAVSTPRWVARRSMCKNNLKQIGIGLHNYLEEYKTFPPAMMTDENGRPMHSWRVLLLPYLDQQIAYDRYDFNEPWDGPHNRKLLSEVPQVFACPESYDQDGHRHLTSYLAVAGSQTALPDLRGNKIGDFKDGSSNALLLIEYTASDIPWTEPRDLTLDNAVRILTAREPETWDGHQHDVTATSVPLVCLSIDVRWNSPHLRDGTKTLPDT
jgi:hypothetical protein